MTRARLARPTDAPPVAHAALADGEASAYAELWWCDALWPDFDAAAYDAALEGFAQRSRRYGT